MRFLTRVYLRLHIGQLGFSPTVRNLLWNIVKNYMLDYTVTCSMYSKLTRVPPFNGGKQVSHQWTAASPPGCNATPKARECMRSGGDPARLPWTSPRRQSNPQRCPHFLIFHAKVAHASRVPNFHSSPLT